MARCPATLEAALGLALACTVDRSTERVWVWELAVPDLLEHLAQQGLTLTWHG